MPDLGRAPDRLNVNVQRGFPFRASLKKQDGSDWEVAPEIRLDSGDVWPSTASGPVASWDIPAASVDAARHGEAIKVVLGDVLWGEGRLQEGVTVGFGGRSQLLVLPAADGGQVIASPAIKGDEGRGIASIADPTTSGTAVVTYTDGTVDELPLPEGAPGQTGAPGGSDEATATWILEGAETRPAVEAIAETAITEKSYIDQNDLAALVRDLAPRYTSALFTKVATDKYQCRFHDGERGATYQFVKDALDDFIKLDACYTGFGYSKVDFYVPTTADLTGTWVTATSTWYTTVVGGTFTGTVRGSRIDIFLPTESRGGMWHVTVDGGAPVPVSCWSATSVGGLFTVASGLDPDVDHTVVATFQGDDPAHPPSSSPSRGYVRIDPTGTLVGYVEGAATTSMVIADGSNKEMAFVINDGAPFNWLPDHGVGSAFAITPAEVVIDGSVVNIAAMPVGDTLPIVESMELRQHFNGRVASTGTSVVEVRTKHVVRAAGHLEFTGHLVATSSTLLTGYPLMLPAMEPTTNEFVTGIGSRQVNAKSDAEVGFPNDRDAVFSGAVVSSTNRNLIGAATLTVPRLTLRRGKPNRRPVDERLFVWHRATKPKLYWSAALEWPLVTGDAYAWGFTLVVADIPHVYDMLT